MSNTTPYKNARALKTASRAAVKKYLVEGEKAFPDATLSHVQITAADDVAYQTLLEFADNLGDISPVQPGERSRFVKMHAPIVVGEAKVNWLQITQPSQDTQKTGPAALVFAKPTVTEPRTEQALQNPAFVLRVQQHGAAALVAAQLPPRVA